MMNMFPSSHFSFRPEESFLLQPGYAEPLPPLFLRPGFEED